MHYEHFLGALENIYHCSGTNQAINEFYQSKIVTVFQNETVRCFSVTKHLVFAQILNKNAHSGTSPWLINAYHKLNSLQNVNINSFNYFPKNIALCNFNDDKMVA